MRQSYCEMLFIFQWRNKLKVYWIGKNSVFKLNCGQEDDGYIMSREIKYLHKYISPDNMQVPWGKEQVY